MSSAAKRDAFLAVWPSLATELVDYLRGEGMPKDAVDWFQRVRSLPLLRRPPPDLDKGRANSLLTTQSLDYNTPGGPYCSHASSARRTR